MSGTIVANPLVLVAEHLVAPQVFVRAVAGIIPRPLG